MKTLLHKKHYCYKIHIYITNKQQCLPSFYRQPPYIGYSPQFYKKILIPTSMIFEKFQPPYE